MVINSICQQVFSPECFAALGVDLSEKRLVVVKSTQHFQAAFAPIAGAMIYCNAPGSLEHGPFDAALQSFDAATLNTRNARPFRQQGSPFLVAVIVVGHAKALPGGEVGSRT